MGEVLSVSELNNQIKSLLEATFLNVSVHGEVSNLTYHSSGHIYFTLKDSSSSIRAVLFKGNALKIKFRIQEGMDLSVYGALSLYAPRGEYQILIQSAEPTGVGSLSLAFIQLKKELESLGYFDNSQKKHMPKFPTKIALITSATGAAVQDMLRVANKRWSGVHITLLNTLVQGDGAKESIAKNIEHADSLGVDIIIVGRGGGSIEDLWAFNERVVADAIYNAKTPIVSAVGHESDIVISDFVADLRAPTPSAAMELVLPDSSEWLLRLDSSTQELNRALKRVLERKILELDSLKRGFLRSWIPVKISKNREEIIELKRAFYMSIIHRSKALDSLIIPLDSSLKRAFVASVQRKSNELEMLKARLDELNPEANFSRGYVKLSRKSDATYDKNLELGELMVDDEFALEDFGIRILARVVDRQRKDL